MRGIQVGQGFFHCSNHIEVAALTESVRLLCEASRWVREGQAARPARLASLRWMTSMGGSRRVTGCPFVEQMHKGGAPAWRTRQEGQRCSPHEETEGWVA